MKRLIYLFFILLIINTLSLAQRTDLSGIKILIDPGHGGHNAANDRHVIPDPGTDFWESESNFQKAQWLKTMLEEKGAAVMLTRYTNDYPNDDEPSLGARVALANANNVNWFHSIHSNATGWTVNNTTNYTLMLVREKRSSDPFESNTSGLGIPERPESLTMANIMGTKIKTFNRTSRTVTYLDWTFYGGTNGGFSLGVLRGLSMPGELSEGSFHDYFPETRRLMNNSYCKVEAYSLRNSFFEYYGLPADTMCIIAGTLKDITQQTMINKAKVRLTPGDKIFNGDSYNNGYYMFDKLAPGQYTLYFETDSYIAESLNVTVSSGTITFIDKDLLNLTPPKVASTTPFNGDTAVSVYNPITINFGKKMDTASVRSAFSISPVTPGNITWSSNNTTFKFTPASELQSLKIYTVQIEGSASDIGGIKLDGNGDGIGGDAYVLRFKTLISDAERPYISSSNPLKNSTARDFPLNGVITITFNRLMDTTSLISNISLRKSSIDVEVNKYYTNYKGKTIVTIVPKAPLVKNSIYVTIIYNQVKDIYQNNMKAMDYFYMYTGNRSYKNIQTLESFSAGLTNWKAPTYSGSTVGIIPDSTTNAEETNIYLPGTGDKKSMALNYSWKPDAAPFLIREYLSQGTPYTTLIDTAMVLQAFVFGDSSNNRFRFCVDDSSTLVSHKVNLWTTIDWYGWKMIEWKLSNPAEIGNWLVNSPIVGPKNRFDSYQIAYDPAKGSKSGTIYFDELRIAEIDNTSGISEYKNIIPTKIDLDQNYPNPFNPSTTIRFRVVSRDFVNLKIYDALGREKAILINQELAAGEYTTQFNANNLPSGIYFYKLTTSTGSIMKKMELLK